MPQFTRPTVIAACRMLDRSTQGRLESFLLEHALENVGTGLSVEKRVNAVIKHLLADPDAKGSDGENLIDSLVRALVERDLDRYDDTYNRFDGQEPALARALARDGFVVAGGQLRRAGACQQE